MPAKKPSSPAPEPAATPRLYRSKTDRVFAGVAGGIAEYLQVDPTIIRLIFVVLTLAGGSGLLLYIVAWIVTPENPVDLPAGAAVATAPNPAVAHRGRSIAGVILLAIGAMALAQNLWGFYGWDRLWPLILIVIGLGFLVGRR